MKKKFTILITALLLIHGMVSSQVVYEDDVNMSLGIKNAIYVDIEGADKKLAEKVWKEYIKSFGKTKRNKKAKEWYVEKAEVAAITNENPVDLYLKIEELRDMVKVYLWVDLGFDFVNSVDFNKESEGAERFLTDYYLSVRRKVVEKEIDVQEKIVKNLEKNLDKLKDENEKYHKEIQEYREKITKMEAEIEQNNVDQKDLTDEIMKQKRSLENIIRRLNSIGNH